MKGLPVIPENAPFNAEQRLWLNGFLAGLFANGETPAPAAGEVSSRPMIPLMILFGSQTGTSEKLARQIAKEAKARGCSARVVDAAAHTSVDWKSEQNLFVVTSTYGDGDLPDNAQAFWDWLKSDAPGSLAHLSFSVLALGDTNYEQFCAAGKKIDARLEALGAKRIHPRADCELDYEAKAKEWMSAALAVITENSSSSPVTAKSEAPGPVLTERYGKKNPFPARLLKNVLLNKEGSDKEVRHYEISLAGSGLSYEVGDALGVMPVNCPELVDEIVSTLKAKGDEIVNVGDASFPLREALQRQLDITKPSQELFATIAHAAPAGDLAALLAMEKREELRKWLYGRGVIDLLHLLAEPLPVADFVKLLKRLTPRLYSISSSPKAHPGEVHLTVGAVRYETHGRERKGVASTFLADRVGDADYVKVFVQPSHGFKPPSDGATPIIMVGPGTGIAPFRAFLEERKATGAPGRNWLFFGDQRRTTDFLYEEILTAWQAEKFLTRLDLAFSRDQAEKIYVQHRMLEHAGELWRWLQDGAHFYVCGDASRMAKDVDAALQQVAVSAGGLSADAAADYVKQLKSDKRYQRDVY
ncbi:MAG: sulfite reductase subunit alpha [Verrucomicrobiota bacterium]